MTNHFFNLIVFKCHIFFHSLHYLPINLFIGSIRMCDNKLLSYLGFYLNKQHKYLHKIATVCGKGGV